MRNSAKKKQPVRLNTKAAPTYDAAAERERNFIGERIAEARLRQNMNLTEFSRLLAKYGVEISSSGINKWELGKAIPNGYQLFAIAHALGLEDEMGFFSSSVGSLNDDGRRKLEEYKADLLATGLYKPAPRRTTPAVIRYITKPVSYLTASAGIGAFLDEGQFENVRFPENAVPAGADFALHVSGDSMEPVYHDGQIVWVQQCGSLNPGEVGIFLYDGNGYIKSYDEQEPDEGDAEAYTDSDGRMRMQPVLVSYNEKYAPILISPDVMFQIVGRVL